MGVFKNCKSRDTDFGRNPTLFLGGKKGTEFIRTKTVGLPKETSYFERAVIGVGKHTYTTVLYTQLITYVHC